MDDITATAIDVTESAYDLEQPDGEWMDRLGMDQGGARYKAVKDADGVQILDKLSNLYPKLNAKQQKIVVYCYHGNMSRGGTAYLLGQGFADVSSMSGGFEGWRGQHPQESGG